MVSIPLLIVAGLALLVVGAILLGVGYLLYIRWAVLSGRRGTEAMWAASLVAAEDKQFTEAMRNTPQKLLTLYGKKAESKQELRELVVENYEKAEDLSNSRDNN